MSRKRWTENEEEYLRTYVAKGGNKNYLEAAKTLNRTPKSVKSKAQIMRLVEEKNYWSEDDLIYLEYFLYDNDERRYKEAAEFLGRTVKAVSQKACEMRKETKDAGYINRPYSKKEIEFIRANYTVIETNKLAERLGRTIHSVMRKASVLGIHKRKSLSNLDAEIRSMAARGKTRNEIAFKLGLKPNSVICYLIKHDIKCNYAPKELSQQYFREQENLRRAEVNHRLHQ